MASKKQTFYWHPSGNSDIVNFASETKCSYLELAQNSRTSAAAKIEGILDEASLLAWLEKVLHVTNDIIYYNQGLIIHQDHKVCSVGTGQETPSETPSSKLRIL
jgi:hypothetical protein